MLQRDEEMLKFTRSYKVLRFERSQMFNGVPKIQGFEFRKLKFVKQSN